MLATFTATPFRKTVLFYLICLLSSFPAFAGLTVSPIFGSNMVLQRSVPVPVFGTADPNALVTVQFQNQTVTGTADGGGKWKVYLSSMAASTAPGSLTVSSNGNTLTFTGVQVGEVWLCSGQSNMGFPLSNADSSAAAIADAGNHNIRLFRMTAGNGPATTTWQVANSTTVGNFSAVGYWMGLELSQWFGTVPIGLIQATHDGTSIDHWEHSSGGIGDDYDAMVKAIQPFAIKGVAWYQGESNGGDADYRAKLTSMLREWRGDWGQTQLPFGIIQLAYRSGWNTARNAQLQVADSEPACFLVVIRDLPGGALHPTMKKPVGLRTAIGARGLVYGDAITYSGPVRDTANSYVSGSKIILNWKFPGNGLFTDDGKAPGGFSVATATGQFKTATAAIVGNTIEITSPVANPARVQYAYSTIGNLYNKVSILTAGGKGTVDRLKASEFEIKVAPKAGALVQRTTMPAEYTFMTSSLSVYPNPAVKGQFTVDVGSANETKVAVQITDVQGRVVYKTTQDAGRYLQVNSGLLPGTYLVKVIMNNGAVKQQKLLVQ